MFQDFSKHAASVLVYRVVEPAAPLGITGFVIGVEVTATSLDNRKDYWKRHSKTWMPRPSSIIQSCWHRIHDCLLRLGWLFVVPSVSSDPLGQVIKITIGDISTLLAKVIISLLISISNPLLTIFSFYILFTYCGRTIPAPVPLNVPDVPPLVLPAAPPKNLMPVAGDAIIPVPFTSAPHLLVVVFQTLGVNVAETPDKLVALLADRFTAAGIAPPNELTS